MVILKMTPKLAIQHKQYLNNMELYPVLMSEKKIKTYELSVTLVSATSP